MRPVNESIDDPGIKTPYFHIWLPFCVAFLLRLIVVSLNYRETPDAVYFYERFGWEMGWIARSLASGHGYSSPFFPFSGPTALMPPLYPWIIAGIFHLFGVYSTASAFVVLALNSLFSSLTCISIYFIAKHALTPRIALIATWAWALHPFSIYFSVQPRLGLRSQRPSPIHLLLHRTTVKPAEQIGFMVWFRATLWTCSTIQSGSSDHVSLFASLRSL